MAVTARYDETRDNVAMDFCLHDTGLDGQPMVPLTLQSKQFAMRQLADVENGECEVLCQSPVEALD